MDEPTSAERGVFASCRIYAHERRVEYRGTVVNFVDLKEEEICSHVHRTQSGALRCAKKMCRQWNKS